MDLRIGDLDASPLFTFATRLPQGGYHSRTALDCSVVRSSEQRAPHGALLQERNMKVGTNIFALVALVPIWGLSGCSQQDRATTTAPDARGKGAENHHKHTQHADARSTRHGSEEHAKHQQQKHHAHARGEHKLHGNGGHEDREPPPQGSVKVGDKVPDFSVRTLDGQSVQLSDLRKDVRRSESGVVVLSFWCSTCHSCRDVEHLLAQLAKDYSGRAAVIALDANSDETPERVAAFVKKNGLELPVVLDSSGKTADVFGVRRTTTTVIIDGNGVLRYCGQFQQKD